MYSWFSNYRTDFENLLVELEAHKPNYFVVDTESTGLNLTKDKPFLVTCGFCDHNNKKLIWAFEPSIQKLEALKKLLINLKKTMIFFWNAKFDLHMLANFGSDYSTLNIHDGMVIAKLIFSVDGIEHKSFALKNVANNLFGKKIDKSKLNAEYENFINKNVGITDPNTWDIFCTLYFNTVWIENNQSILEELAVKNIRKFLQRKDISFLNSLLKRYEYNYGLLKKTLKDPLKGLEALPQDVKDVYQNWCKKPDINHANIYQNYEISYKRVYEENKTLMLSYATKDIELTMDVIMHYAPEISTKNLSQIYRTETKFIKELFRQERIGLKIDIDYLNKSIVNLQQVIKTLRNKIKTITGSNLSAGQHKEIKEWVQKNISDLDKIMLPESVFNTDGDLKSVDARAFDTIKESLNPNHIVVNLIDTLNELRTLEKWYGTYLIQFKRDYLNSDDGRIRVSNNQFNTKTGRLSNNFQQFPREGLTIDNKELFNPRKLVITDPDSGYNYLFYFDYSQVELRLTAEYTIREYGEGDINLCRAYIPYKLEGQEKKDWKETDLHALNPAKAFDIPYDEFMAVLNNKDHPNYNEYKRLRSAGKIVNFACNYGSGVNGLFINHNLRAFNKDQINKLHSAYKQNFPKVVNLTKDKSLFARSNGWVENIFGRKYFFLTKDKTYRAVNYIVQGAGADLLKTIMIKVTKFLTDNNYKSRILFSVHDEIQIEITKDELFIVPKIKEIMEYFPSFTIPIICDVEYSKTNWSEKVPYNIE